MHEVPTNAVSLKYITGNIIFNYIRTRRVLLINIFIIYLNVI